MPTQEQFDEAIAQNTRLPTHPLPWHQHFVSMYGRESQNRYKDVVSMMKKYGESMRIRDAAKQQENAELKEHLVIESIHSSTAKNDMA